MGDDSDCLDQSIYETKEVPVIDRDFGTGSQNIKTAKSIGELVWSPNIDWQKDVPEQYQAETAGLASRTQKIGNIAKRWLKFAGAMVFGGVAALGFWFMVDPGGSFTDIEIPVELAEALAKFDLESTKSALALPFEAATSAIASMVNGPLVKMLAVAMFIVGGGIAITRNSVMPAISGIMGAIFLSYGPSIILSATGINPDDGKNTAEVYVRKALEKENYKEALELIDKYAPLSNQTSYVLAQIAYKTKQTNPLRAALEGIGSQPSIPKQKQENPSKADIRKAESRTVDAWKPDMARMYEMEKTAYGTPQSESVVSYADSKLKSKAFFGSTSAVLFGLGLINLLMSGGLFGLWIRLNKRIETIASLAKTLKRVEPPAHKGIIE